MSVRPLRTAVHDPLAGWWCARVVVQEFITPE